MQDRSVVLLTTWNRPKLLAQSLPQIIRESKRIGADLIISDDQSDDRETLELLNNAKNSGCKVIRRDYLRKNITSHDATGLNNLYGFKYLCDNYPDAELFIKVDDDTYHSDGSFQKMVEAWDLAISEGHDVLHMSGIATEFEERINSYGSYSEIRKGCNAAIIYRASDWHLFLREANPRNVMMDGFDVHFMRLHWVRHRPLAVPMATNPSVVYHTGLTGVHVIGKDINVDFIGPRAGILVE